MAAGEDLAEILNVDKQAPLLYMDEIGYSFMGEPLLVFQGILCGRHSQS